MLNEPLTERLAIHFYRLPPATHNLPNSLVSYVYLRLHLHAYHVSISRHHRMNKILNLSRLVIVVMVTLFISSCNKQYSCTCKTISSNKDTILDVVETTKLGSKGFKATCTNHETSNAQLKDCHI